MKKKLIITETQLKNLKKLITETAHSRMVKKISEELNQIYKVVNNVVREGGDYHSTIMFENQIDGESISAKDLFEYLKHKHVVGEEFIKQVIKDWVDGRITDDYRLSKNTPLM